MSAFKTFIRSGHWPTLAASFLYFDFCFAIWVLNGAMAPFISESFGLNAAQKGFMVSVPILAGALMRFPLGVLAQYIGRKNAAMVEMALIVAALGFGYFFVGSYDSVLAMGVLLGIAGASFGVALSLGSGWFPARYKGLAMGIAGAGNSGTVLAVLFAPPLAQAYGWQTVYGLAALTMLLPMAVMWFAAKEPPDREKQTLREHVACLFEKDGWAFSLIYIVTFGGFIGLASFLPTYFHDQFKVSKIEAGQLTMLATLMGSAVRVVGGYVSDRLGGITTLSGVLLLVAATLTACGFSGQSLAATTLLFMLCFAALGAGNGALFQLVPLRWPLTTAVAGSMIGEIGALGGGFLPNAMGLSKQWAGTYLFGFLSFTALALLMLAMLRIVQIRWTRTWAEKGGRARQAAPSSPGGHASTTVHLRGAAPASATKPEGRLA
ncbi:MAG: NarK/NasA family nitrate transporter [Burkholderiales bacterium]|nr:NarK/NasA family nitrate transporter [Burkholderiales bacterium]